MNDTRAALRYAKAILNLAKESKSETQQTQKERLIPNAALRLGRKIREKDLQYKKLFKMYLYWKGGY